MQQQTIDELRLVANGGRPPEDVVARLLQLGLVVADGPGLVLTAAGRHWVRRGSVQDPQDGVATVSPASQDARDQPGGPAR